MPTSAGKNRFVTGNKLDIVEWAQNIGANGGVQKLAVMLNERSVAVAQSEATGEALISNGNLGADIIRLAAGEAFAPHVHPGDHLLIVIGGDGTVTYGGKIYPTRAGQIYMVEGEIPHAVGAITDHVILAVGCPHKAIHADDRMTVTEYASITVDLEELHCLICNKKAVLPQRIHELGCPHCVCPECVLTEA